MSENLGFGWGNQCQNGCEEHCNFGGGCNGSFFETLIMLIIIIWLLRCLAVVCSAAKIRYLDAITAANERKTSF